jgi:hypothetical protein
MTGTVSKHVVSAADAISGRHRRFFLRRESHQEGITLVGSEVGSPIIAVPGPDPAHIKTAFFGPVVSPAPIGDQAARLWDAILAAASTPGFFEIKRTRTVGPVFDQA